MKILLILCLISMAVERCARNYIKNDTAEALAYKMNIPTVAGVIYLISSLASSILAIITVIVFIINF